MNVFLLQWIPHGESVLALALLSGRSLWETRNFQQQELCDTGKSAGFFYKVPVVTSRLSQYLAHNEDLEKLSGWSSVPVSLMVLFEEGSEYLLFHERRFIGLHCKRQAISESCFWYQPNSRSCESFYSNCMRPEHCWSSFWLQLISVIHANMAVSLQNTTGTPRYSFETTVQSHYGRVFNQLCITCGAHYVWIS